MRTMTVLFRYLLNQLKLVVSGRESAILSSSCDSNGLYRVRNEVSFHFFATQSPCM